MINTVYFIGFDISKATFHYRIDDHTGDKLAAGVCDNTAQGIREFIGKLSKITTTFLSIHSCMEATGRCGRELWAALTLADIAVSVVNPAQIKAYATSLNKRGKNDTMDASTIARFVRERRPYTMAPPSKSLAGLRELVGEIDHLVAEGVRVKARLGEVLGSGCKPVIGSLKRQLKTIEKETIALQGAIEVSLKEDIELGEDVALLESIPGIARRTAVRVLAQIGGKEFGGARQLAAYAGVTPADNQSGTSLHKKARMSKKGNAALRCALYMPALTMKRICQPVGSWARGIAERTGSKKAALGAVMRKLIHIIYGVLKHRRPFDLKNLEKPAF